MKQGFRIAIPRLTAIAIFPGGCPIFLPAVLLARLTRPAPEPMVTATRQEGKTEAAEMYMFGDEAEARAFNRERIEPHAAKAPEPMNGCSEGPSTAEKETFTAAEIEHAISSFLDYGEQSRVPEDQPRGHGHYGYYSGPGWAARALRYHLRQLQEGRAEKAPTAKQEDPINTAGPTNTTFAEREKIITAMVETMRGHAGEYRDLGAYWEKTCREAAKEIFNHHIDPIIKERDQARQEQKITEMMLNRARGFNVNMPMVTTFDAQPLDWWRELRLQAHSDAEQLKLIAAALRRAGIEEKKDTPPHATVSLLASQYLKLLEGKTPAGMVAMDRERMEQLQAIEREHKAVIAELAEQRTANASMHKMIMAIREHFKAWDTPTAPTDQDIVDCIIRHADDPHRIQEFMGKRLDHWLELEMLAQQYGVEKIVDAHAERRGELLALMAVLGRAGTFADVQWMVQEIGRLKDPMTGPSFTLPVHEKEYHRLLEIERGHRADKDRANVAEEALKRAHKDLNQLASEHDFKERASADGSRLKLLNQISSHILALESEVEHLRQHPPLCANGDLLKDLGNVKMERDALEQIVTRIAALLDLPPWPDGTTLTTPTVDEITEEIQRLREAATPGLKPMIDQMKEMLTNQVLAENARLADKVDHQSKELLLLYSRVSDTVGRPITSNADVIQVAHDASTYKQKAAALADAESRADRYAGKITALRRIVQRKAPHTGDCLMKPINPQSALAVNFHGTDLHIKCGCWKAEFMAEADKQ